MTAAESGRPPNSRADCWFGYHLVMSAELLDGRITWVRGAPRPGPMQLIGVLELKADGSCRAVFAERVEVDGRCHILLARQAWEGKDALDTRWWSLVLDDDHKAFTVRNGSCGDPLLPSDVPRIVRALEELNLMAEDTMIAVDGGVPVLPRRQPAVTVP
ncbi:MAG: hypothetical protein ABIS92_11485 [Polyangia bacterium]